MSLERSGVDDGPLRLARILEKWIALVEETNRRWTDPGDSAWLYNERASLSIVAGAVWLCDGIAFEVPKIPISQFELQDELLSSWFERVRSIPNHGVAWCFPERAREKTWEKYHYPGVVLLLRKWRHRPRARD